MSTAKTGDTVKVHYTGKLEDGEIFDSSEGRQPLEFEIGSGRLIKGFEQGVIGMEIGDTRQLTIAPNEGYGDKRQDLLVRVEREKIPANVTVGVGQHLKIPQPNGQAVNVIVQEVTDDTVLLDANHPLAGKTLVFDVEMVEIA